MKKVELSDEAYAALLRLAAARNLSPNEAVATILNEDRPPLAGDLLLFHLAGAEFAAQPNATGRYLNLLAWVARNYRCDFADFISHQESGRRYLMLSRDEVNAVREHNQACQLAGTQYWAVMTIDETTKRRFVCRLLEFIGCHDEIVVHACRALGLSAGTTGFRLLSA